MKNALKKPIYIFLINQYIQNYKTLMSKDIFKKGHQKTGEKSSTLKYCPAKVR